MRRQQNCWFPNVGTNASQSHKHGFPIRGSASSPAFEPMLPNLGTYASQSWNHGFPARGTDGPNVGTNAPQAWNYVFRVLGIAGCFQAWNHGFRVPETVYLTCKNYIHVFRAGSYVSQLDMCLISRNCDPHAFVQSKAYIERICISKKLDDGWPESVKEQSLLVLVWKHIIRRQYIKDVKIGRREE